MDGRTHNFREDFLGNLITFNPNCSNYLTMERGAVVPLGLLRWIKEGRSARCQCRGSTTLKKKRLSLRTFSQSIRRNHKKRQCAPLPREDRGWRDAESKISRPSRNDLTQISVLDKNS